MDPKGNVERVSKVAQENAFTVTSCLLEAFLDCPTKCYLLSKGAVFNGNEYTRWKNSRAENYIRDCIRKLATSTSRSNLLQNDAWKSTEWDFALGKFVYAHGRKAHLQLVERSAQGETNAPFKLIPTRFVADNKLSFSHKIMATFDALTLSKHSGIKIGTAKIVYGNKRSINTVKVANLSRKVHKAVIEVATLLSATSAPDLVLNRHCPECNFQERCKKEATDKDDLSLLSRLTDKERIKLRAKGIFTITQLSYTFRPRRRAKRLKEQPERYHHSLKALAIREHKIHIAGRPDPPLNGTAIFFDVEGIPDRDFYYLIGVRIEHQNSVSHYSFWADSTTDEKHIWADFLEILSGFEQPVLLHYGSFETIFLKRMRSRYGAPPEHTTVGRAIASPINILSTIYAQIYFPVYSNGLKDIARLLGFEWSSPSASGLNSIAWRSQWETIRDPALRDKLITYNTEDCNALSLVTHAIQRILASQPSPAESSQLNPEIIHAESLSKNLTSKWREFKSPLPDLEYINQASYWDYQRDRVFVRSGLTKSCPRRVEKRNQRNRKIEKKVLIRSARPCPNCGQFTPKEGRRLTRTVDDLIFGRDSLKRRLVQYVLQTYVCGSCGRDYGLSKSFLHGHRWGWNVTAYFVYHIIGLRIPQLTMQHNLNRLFGFNLVRSTLNNLKIKAADYYCLTKKQVLERIVHGSLIHVDETCANIKGQSAYVWVLTNMREVVYILSESREGEMIKTLLKNFKGVLVSDFYAAYDAIECPQQKCLIHLMRDLNDEILRNPFDEELKLIVVRFAELLRRIIKTIDRRGLKKYFLNKHKSEVNQFFKFLEITKFESETALKCKKRFEKNHQTLFTFLNHDGVPWNNNNAEHAIKAFARLRDVISGSSSKKGIDEYLTLLTVAETCNYQRIDFLTFLRSGEIDIQAFADSRHKKFDDFRFTDIVH